MKKVVCFGELLVDMVGQSGFGLQDTPSFLKVPGGAPANVAVGLVRLGAEAHFVGQVGNDPFGEWLRQIMQQENVGVEHLSRSETARTTLAFIATRLDGRKEISFYRHPGADAQLDTFDAQALDGATIFHAGSVSLSLSPCRETQIEAMKLARERGLIVSYDPNWRPSLWPDEAAARDMICSVLSLCDVVKLAEEEMEFVTGHDDVEAAANWLREQGAQIAVITSGERGAYFDAGEYRGWSAARLSEVVDTLGAGDAFMAGLLAQISESGATREDMVKVVDWPRALEFANKCGALAVRKAGAIPALPTRDEVAAFED